MVLVKGVDLVIKLLPYPYNYCSILKIIALSIQLLLYP